MLEIVKFTMNHQGTDAAQRETVYFSTEKVYGWIWLSTTSPPFIQALEYAKTIVKPPLQSQPKPSPKQQSSAVAEDGSQLTMLELLRIRHEEEKQAVARFQKMHVIWGDLWNAQNKWRTQDYSELLRLVDRRYLPASFAGIKHQTLSSLDWAPVRKSCDWMHELNLDFSTSFELQWPRRSIALLDYVTRISNRRHLVVLVSHTADVRPQFTDADDLTSHLLSP